MSTASLTSMDSVRAALKWLDDEFILVQADMVRSARSSSGNVPSGMYGRFRAIQTLRELVKQDQQ